MADKKVVKKFLSTHSHFELFRDDQDREKFNATNYCRANPGKENSMKSPTDRIVMHGSPRNMVLVVKHKEFNPSSDEDQLSVAVRCKLTGHELPARLSDLENYTKGKKYQRLIKDIPNESPGFEEYKEFLVPSEKHRNQLYCELTKRYINNAPHHIQRHVTGKRFIRALEKHRDQQKLKGDNSDEEMWVPSDLESDSEIEDEEEAGEKNEENEEDSGGEFSSEEDEDSYEMKDEDSAKRTLKETKKKKTAKKPKTHGGEEEKAMKPQKPKTKTSKKS